MTKLAIIFDCGATNVRVMAINSNGHIEASQSYPNQTSDDPYWAGGRIWDIEAIWGKLCRASLAVTAQIDTRRIAGVSTTTFGVDGTFLDKEGNLVYPVISWQCERTAPIMANISEFISLDELYSHTGVYPYGFNTINKLIWFKKHRPDVLEKAADFLFMPSLLNYKLTNQRVNDATMAGTSMLASHATRRFSDKVFNALGVSPHIFAPVAEGGEMIGTITAEASAQTGLPQGIPVCLAGHDTQYALVGSGAGPDQPVLSSGTWEILMTRSRQCTCSHKELELGITTELDAIPGMYNIGLNYIGSGALEWLKNHFFADMPADTCYAAMIEEAENIEPGSNNVVVNPDFYPVHQSRSQGSISGLTMHTTRAQIYRAALEALANKLQEALFSIEKAGNFKASSIICVGGGSRNRLWNQLRADSCGIPVKTINQKETTVLGAAQFVFTGTGVFSSIEEAQQAVDYSPTIYEPNKNFSPAPSGAPKGGEAGAS